MRFQFDSITSNQLDELAKDIKVLAYDVQDFYIPFWAIPAMYPQDHFSAKSQTTLCLDTYFVVIPLNPLHSL
jgi:hypothetical protein